MRLLTLGLLCSSTLCASPAVPWNTGRTDPAFAKIPFLNLSKIEMHQSYTFQYVSMGGKSASGGLYLNEMSYPLASTLKLQVALGASNMFFSEFSAQNARPEDMPKFQMPYLGLEWNPTKNLSVGLHYIQIDCSQGYCPLSSPWGGPSLSPWRNRAW
jgi:hypothetical protein